jgi:hypothetical protein
MSQLADNPILMVSGSGHNSYGKGSTASPRLIPIPAMERPGSRLDARELIASLATSSTH